MDYGKALEGYRLHFRALEAVVSHHWEPDSKTLQRLVLEFLEKFADNTLSVHAHRSRR